MIDIGTSKAIAFLLIIFIIMTVIIYISLQITKRNKCPVLPTAPTTKTSIYSINTMTNIQNKPVNQLPINRLHIKTAYNCCCKGYFRNDYVDVIDSGDDNTNFCALRNCALNGARALDFTIYQMDGKPIISASTAVSTKYKEQYNELPFDLVMQQVERYFLLDNNSSVISDPLFLILRIYGDKQKLYDDIAYSLTNRFGTGRNAGAKIYTNKITGNTPISEFQTLQVVIIVEPYDVELYNKSSLNKITAYMLNNGSIEPYINRNNNNVTSNFDTKILIMYPELDTSSSRNFNPTNSFVHNIPFIGMNFQKNDANLKIYNKKFETQSIIPQDNVIL